MSEVNPHTHKLVHIANTLIGSPVRWCKDCGKVLIGPSKGGNALCQFEVGSRNAVMLESVEDFGDYIDDI